MTPRSEFLLSQRPVIPTAIITENMHPEEKFQNQTLRPVIKMQNDLLLAVFKNYIGKHKNVFYELSLQKQIDYIENAIHKDMKFRNSVKGMLIGHFTIEEFQEYIQNSSNLNKRMMNIVKERLISNIQILVGPDILKAV